MSHKTLLRLHLSYTTTYTMEEIRVLFLNIYAMFDPVAFFGAFCIVEAVESTDKVASDSANALEFNAFTNHAFLYCRHLNTSDFPAFLPADAGAGGRMPPERGRSQPCLPMAGTSMSLASRKCLL